jgi:hypothetical protein
MAVSLAGFVGPSIPEGMRKIPQLLINAAAHYRKLTQYPTKAWLEFRGGCGLVRRRRGVGARRGGRRGRRGGAC